ncbi:MAG TPA: SWIM zinc finger family protein, partial [Pirellulaceae bacterium]|nr:SWIM zinc finger family protein [Pirellulaceae bacterium]
MLLTQRLSNFFPSALRNRGEGYISPKVTSITKVTNRSVDAIAHGSEDYTLQLEWGPGSDKLFATCTCPYAAEQGLCKHVWGLLRQLETTRESAFPKRFQSIFEGPMVKAQPRPTPAAPGGLGANRDLLNTRDLSEVDFESAVNRLLDSVEDDLDVFAPSSTSKSNVGQTRGSSQSAPKPALEPWQFRSLLMPWARQGKATDAPPLHYCVTIRAARDGSELCVLMFQARQDGDGTQRYVEVKPEQVLSGQTDISEDDHEIVEELQGFETDFWGRRPSKPYLTLGDNPFKTLQQLFLTGHLYFAPRGTRSPDHPDTNKIEYIEHKPLIVRQRIDELVGGDYSVRAQLFNSQGKEIVERPRVSSSSGLLLFSNWVARLPREFAPLFQQVGAQEPVRIPAENAAMLSRFVYEHDVPLAEELPESLRMTEVAVKPKGLVRFEQHSAQWFGKLAASYDDVIVEVQRLGVFHFSDDLRLVRRDREAENGLLNEAWGLEALELGRVFFQPPSLRIPKPKFTTVLRYFLERGWIVEVNKKRIGSAGLFGGQMPSGIPWFNVDGQVAFCGTGIRVPKIFERI